jgi:hypothetical protein
MDQQRSRNEDMPNRSSNMEPAEGSRESVNNRSSESDSSSQGPGTAHGGGISNRSLDRERCEQEQVPDRGESQSDR